MAALPALGAEELEEVTVTGSRIVRRDYEAASPIVTVNEELFDQISTVGVEAALNQLPQFVPAQTMFSSGDVQPSAFNNPGIVTLNLRGLGANRNLVLIDGRRAQPANALLVVDINSIPSAAIESVEVISGGASAVYGADAMGGVTNFKLKKNYEGLNLNIQTSTTEQGGGEETTISALIGGSFGDGGNVMLGITASERQAVMQRERDFYVEGWLDPDTAGSENLRLTNIEFPSTNRPSAAAYASIFGAGKAAAGEEIYVNLDGTIFLNSATQGAVGYTGPQNEEFKILGPGNLNKGTLSSNNLNAMVSTPLKRYSMFARANYDLTDNMNVFLQANMSQMQVNTLLNYAPATSQWAATIPRDGRAIPAQLATLLDSRPNPTGPYTLSRGMDFMGPRTTRNDTDMFQLLAGVQGDIGDSTWSYEAYISHGNTSLLTEMNGFPGLQNYRSVVTAPNFGKNLTLSVGPPLFFELKCTTGLPIFTYFEPSQDCINSIAGNMKHLTNIEQDIVEINLTGELFDLPAGTVGAAVGASTRENSYRWRPDDQLARPSTNYPIGLFPTSATQGKTDVKELYGEMLVPVLNDLPFMSELNLELGARYSDFNTAGEIWTYKGLVDWSVNDNVRVRGGYQRANRAPNVAELFTGATTSVVGFPGGDPCMANTTNPWGNVPANPDRAKVIELCSQIINRSTGGNNSSPWHTAPNFPNAIVGPFPFLFQFELANITGNQTLQNEEADTYTLGLVLNSPFTGLFENATLAIDWYQVEIADAIAPTDSLSVYSKCLNGDGSNPSYTLNEYCGLITRDNDGYRATVDTPYFNLGSIETAGVDVQFNWGFDAMGGLVNVNSVLNFLDYYRDQQAPTAPFVDATGTFRNGGQFDYRTFTTVNFIKDNWSVGLRHRFLPEIESVNYATNKATTTEGADSYQMIDAFGSFTLTDKITLRGGIDNLFDFDPEIVGRTPGTTAAKGITNAGFYDPLGRRYYLAVEMNF
jgi:outer membrane receptor protein involved in Fe transport